MLLAFVNRNDNKVDAVMECTLVEEVSHFFDPNVYFTKMIKEHDVNGNHVDNGSTFKWDPILERFYQADPPEDDWIMNDRKRWQPPMDPPDGLGYIDPPIHPVVEKSMRYRWNPSIEPRGWELRPDEDIIYQEDIDKWESENNKIKNSWDDLLRKGGIK